MPETTVRVKGRALQRFLARLIGARGDIDDTARAALARDLGHMIAGAKIRRIAWSELARRERMAKRLARKPRGAASTGEAQAAASPPPQKAAVGETPAGANPEFDPYSFGLIPLYQRGGGAALRAKLETVDNVEQLRKMARAQQIGLPAEIRRGAVDAANVRDAIVVAVEKRIADRRAAAS